MCSVAGLLCFLRRSQIWGERALPYHMVEGDGHPQPLPKSSGRAIWPAPPAGGSDQLQLTSRAQLAARAQDVLVPRESERLNYPPFCSRQTFVPPPLGEHADSSLQLARVHVLLDSVVWESAGLAFSFTRELAHKAVLPGTNRGKGRLALECSCSDCSLGLIVAIACFFRR